MSQSKCLENILSLMPHIVENYCRMRKRILSIFAQNHGLCERSEKLSNYYGDLLYTDNDDRELNENLGVHQIHIEEFKKCVNEEKEVQRLWKHSEKRLSRRKMIEMASRNLKIENSFLKRKQYAQRIVSGSERDKKESNIIASIHRLATPKPLASQETKEPWKLTTSLKFYKPTQRLLELAQFPKRKDQHLPTLSEILKVKKSALKYNASPRILELAYPKASLPVVKSDAFTVSPKALDAVPSSRVNFLASPRKRKDRIYRKNAFKVKKRALYAKASKWTKELAVPKNLKTGISISDEI